ncbi:MAG TPA: hypothetical protein VFU15_14370 [Bacteroidia bacterium]|nr:hypothetical protein [Bacteroidia bacterium]
MKLFGKLSDFILPKEVDFFGNLEAQCMVTQDVLKKFCGIYLGEDIKTSELTQAITNANELRKKNEAELNEVLITPVDKEAISRAYLNLDWIVLSIKHLNAEAGAYGVSSLQDYGVILGLLKEQMTRMTSCFLLLKEKKYSEVLGGVNDIILLDDEVISEYASCMAQLFNHDSVQHILRHRELLSQLKEVSKRVHFCVNSVEDIVFKMN